MLVVLLYLSAFILFIFVLLYLANDNTFFFKECDNTFYSLIVMINIILFKPLKKMVKAPTTPSGLNIILITLKSC